MNRRELLKLAAGATASELAALAMHGCGGGGGVSTGTPSPVPVDSACSNINDVEHVVIFIQENRSIITLGAIAASGDSLTKVPRFNSQILPTRVTLRLATCCHSTLTRRRRMRRARTTSLTIGCRNIKAGITARWMGLLTHGCRSMRMTRF